MPALGTPRSRSATRHRCRPSTSFTLSREDGLSIKDEKGATGGIINTTPVAIAAAGGAGVRNYLAAIQYMNSAATASEIEIRDGSTVIWRGYVPASMTVAASFTFPVPLRGTANTALNVALLTTATATRVSAQGYTSPN